jgi:hypothetical protein
MVDALRLERSGRRFVGVRVPLLAPEQAVPSAEPSYIHDTTLGLYDVNKTDEGSSCGDQVIGGR